MPRERFDLVVVGGGPVGLHAALKAAVLNHTALVVDKGVEFSRVSQAQAIANVPGAPGISGRDLLARGRRDLRAFRDLAGKDLVTLADRTEAVAARREDGGFAVRLRDAAGAEREVFGRALVLATGTVDRKPGIGGFYERGHATLGEYVHEGEVGYCVLCEGWEAEGKRIAVVGSRHAAAQIAIDLSRHFHGSVTLLTDGAALEREEDAGRLREAGVATDARIVERLADAGGALGVAFAEGADERFDKAFIAFGWYKVNNELACALGARVTDEGYVVTDENSEVVGADGKPIRGLFAVGDLRAGRWKQIVVGWGDAETAVITAYAHRLPDR